MNNYIKPDIEVLFLTSNVLCASVTNDDYNESNFNWW